MSVTQVRLPEGLIKEVDKFVRKGFYASKSDVIREALRNFLFERKVEDLVGIIPNTGDSVKEVRAIREKLSKEIKSFEDVKKLEEEFS